MNLQLKLVPSEHECPGFAYLDNLFSREELDKLQAIAKSADIPAEVGMGPEKKDVNNYVRRSKVKWLSVTADTFWFFQKLSRAVSRLNSQFYNFEIDGFGEDVQFTNYESDVSGMYNWHIDRGDKGDLVRKMSLVVQLSEPGEYSGGELQIMHNDAEPVTLEKVRGRLIMFPSYTIHRVTPVTTGSRQSLVAWLCGPPLR